MTTPPETGSDKGAAAGHSSCEFLFKMDKVYIFLSLYLSICHNPATPVCGDQSVNIVSRGEWGAVEFKKKETLEGSVKRVVIHHTALPRCTDLAECRTRLLRIQREHMNNKHFDDIGYNFLVSDDGTLFEGRGWGVVGEHAKGNNGDSLGIAFMGNFNSDTPSAEAILSVKQLLQSGVSQGFINPEFELLGHRDLELRECPGENLYAALGQLKDPK